MGRFSKRSQRVCKSSNSWCARIFSVFLPITQFWGSLLRFRVGYSVSWLVTQLGRQLLSFRDHFTLALLPSNYQILLKKEVFLLAMCVKIQYGTSVR